MMMSMIVSRKHFAILWAYCCAMTVVAATSGKKGGKKGMPPPDEFCVDVVLTGTAGGPVPYNGLSGAGTLVTYGLKSHDCRGINLQFDIGRGTTNQLSVLQLENRLPPIRTDINQVDAIFLTHLHSDHTDDLGLYLQQRWHLLGQDIDIVCTQDVTITNPNDGSTRVMSCVQLVEHIGDAFIASGEMGQRLAENPARRPGGPKDLAKVQTFAPTGDTEIVPVWTQEYMNQTVTVQAITTNHIGGHASYRVNTPVGSVVIGGDASNDDQNYETRTTSTSSQVELLAQGADVLVTSTVHPIFRPGGPSNYRPLFYNRQSAANDVGDMADRAGVATVMLSHLIPSLGAAMFSVTVVPGGPLDVTDYEIAVREGGYQGQVLVGTDLLSHRLYESDKSWRKRR